MRVRVFASLRDAAGGAWMDAEGSTVRELLADVAQRYPLAAPQLKSCKVVVNDREVADVDSPLTEGDEVALLPPVAGGHPISEDTRA